MNIYFINFKWSFMKERLRQNSPSTVRGRCYEWPKLLTPLHTHTQGLTSTFWFCIISTCLQAMTMREMAWWHKCIHQGKISKKLRAHVKTCWEQHFYPKSICNVDQRHSYTHLLYVVTLPPGVFESTVRQHKNVPYNSGWGERFVCEYII